MIDDPTVGQLSRSAHVDEIDLNPAVAALVLGDDFAHACQVKDLANCRGLGRTDDFEERRPPIDKPGFGDAMALWLFIGYTE
jgi:hypothetical protein